MTYRSIIMLEHLTETLTSKMNTGDVIEIEATNERDVFIITVLENDKLISKLKGN